MLNDPHEPINILYFYGSVDRGLCDELEKYFVVLRKEGFAMTWKDCEIAASEQEPVALVNEAHIILFLLSVDFMAADYASNGGVKRALERHQNREARIIPILLRPVHFANSPFGMLQMLPSNARPVTTWPNRDEAFFAISESISHVIMEMRPRRW